MCRWFAYISKSEPCLLEDILITPQHAISKQVHEHYLPGLFTASKVSKEHTTKKEIATRNRLFNSDGLGVGWYTPARSEFGVAAAAGEGEASGVISLPALYRTIQPPNNDANFHSICANTSAYCVFAHIRMATSVVTPFNNHPFVFGRHSFMHNGYVASFIDIKRDVTALMSREAFAHVNGTTDSENLAALYMTYLAGDDGEKGWYKSYSLSEMKVALDRTVQSILDIQKKREANGEKFEPNDLNLAATDGTQMIAFRFRNHPTEQPPSLYYSEEAGVTLNRKFPGHPDEGNKGKEAHETQKVEDHGKHVIVASEPTTSDANQWHLIGKNESVLVDKDSNLKIEEIKVKF